MSNSAPEGEELAWDADGRLRVLGGGPGRKRHDPPPRPGKPVPVEDLPTVKGRRVILMTPAGPVYDHRAATDVYSDESGTWINVCTEEAWYIWRARAQETRPPLGPEGSVVWAVCNVYAEVYTD